MRHYDTFRVLFDTNVLLDAFIETRPQSEEACQALKACSGGADLGLVTPGSLKDVYYVIGKRDGRGAAQAAVDQLMGMLAIVPFDMKACHVAAGSDEPDFEDGLVRAAAELNEVDFILTRDVKAFRNSPVRAVDCREYLRISERHEKGMRRELARLANGGDC